jgi:hypothetical protein
MKNLKKEAKLIRVIRAIKVIRLQKAIRWLK